MSGLFGQSATETDVLKHLTDHPEGRTAKEIAEYLGRDSLASHGAGRYRRKGEMGK